MPFTSSKPSMVPFTSPEVSVTTTPRDDGMGAAAQAQTNAALYPKGYPRVVSTAALPEQVQNWYQMQGVARAVAVAPGVWTPLAIGAEMQDALAAGQLDGFCSSIKAYERVYLSGAEASGTCW
jgi:hypothetical protein